MDKKQNKKGRKSKLSIIINNLEQIKEAKKRGTTDENLAKQLGIAPSTYYKLLNENPQLREEIDSWRTILVDDLIKELFRKSRPRTLTTTRTTEKNGEITIETIEKQVDGDFHAIITLLRNYNPAFITQDRTTVNQKEKELQIREKLADDKLF